jgi:pimeloyl-ACP methyl ester carboxylesterase
MGLPEARHFNIRGADLAVRLAGDSGSPPLLLLHGFPASSRSFRRIIDILARDCFVIAPDLPGFGDSPPVSEPSFARFADLLDVLLLRLAAGSCYLYLHDYGAPPALHLATRAPQRVRGLIIQNANAHESGLGPQWAATRAWWQEQTPALEAQATAHLTLQGTRHQYVGGLPADLAAHVDPTRWEEDWRVMSLPDRLATQRALVLDYRNHVSRFGEIAEYLARWQPPALLLWGRHDVFFDLPETLAWMQALPRMEAHIFDGPHLLLETHADECAHLIAQFIRRTPAP